MLAAWLAVAVAGGLMLSQAAGWSGTRSVAALQSLTPYATLGLGALAVAAAWRGHHPLAFTGALVGIGGLLLAGPLVFPPGQPPAAADAAGLRVAVVNLLYGNESVDAAAGSLSQQSADIVVFSEFTPEHQATLGDHELATDFPYRVEREGWGAGGIAIWSRYPITEGERIPTRNYSLDVTVEGPDGPVALVGVHAATPIFDFEAWRTDLSIIEERTRAADGPTMVVGDFNASYWHPDFRDLLANGFVDAHMAHGQGFSASWPMDTWYPPFVRLDHALTGNGLVSIAVRDFDVPGSDHRGFVVTVAPVEPDL